MLDGQTNPVHAHARALLVSAVTLAWRTIAMKLRYVLKP